MNRDLVLEIVSSYWFKQLFPFFVLFLVPLFLITAVRTLPSPSMVLSGLGPLWFSNKASTASLAGSNPLSAKNASSQRFGRGKEEKRALIPVEDGYYPGLVNISGTYCFMNSTLQAFASLSYLHSYLSAIKSRAEVLDVPTPVIDVLTDFLYRLNTPLSHSTSYRPVELIEVLSSQPSTSGRSASLFRSREHQDAQELFQLLSESIKDEAAEVEKESRRDRGFAGVASAIPSTSAGTGVFDGLTANRRVCVICGYTEAVMHFAFDNLQLAVPSLAVSLPPYFTSFSSFDQFLCL
jgi:ubiquitin carboxyl-terminal hydrolase 1